MPASAPPAAGWWLPILAGLAAGLVAGLFGVGGGVLLVPVLVLLLHRPQHVAHATSLVAVTLAATAGVLRFALDGSVAVQGALALAVGAVVGARAGARFLPRVSEGGLRLLFASVLVLLSIRFLLVGATGEAAAAGDVIPTMTGALLTLHVLGGLAAGIVSSVLGVGGGVIIVPLLVLAFGYGQHIAEGTSLAVIVPTALTGAISHHRNGYTDWPMGLRLGVASLAGSLTGASVALSLSPIVLGRLFGVLLLVTSVLMLRRARTGPDR